MQKHPTSQQVRTVIDNFKKVLPIANGHKFMLDMGCPYIYKEENIVKEESCGTPMCHGGWYAAATLQDKMKEVSLDTGARFGRRQYFMDYNNGAEQMAIDLGFTQTDDGEYENFEGKMIKETIEARTHLRDWASENPQIWGNRNGEDMFHSKDAFETEGSDGAESLQDIVDFWEKVYERIVALEKEVANVN
jgi:hypothetical protein